MHLLPDPPPCAREGCGKNAAAHLGFMLGHHYVEPPTARQGLERASGAPRTVDGPGCTPAMLDGRAAARRALDSVLQPWERDLVAQADASQIPEVPATAEVQPAPPAGATVDEKCRRCGRPFDPTDKHFEGHGRYGDSPFCNGCVSHCYDTEMADHRCIVDDWSTAPRSIRP